MQTLMMKLPRFMRPLLGRLRLKAGALLDVFFAPKLAAGSSWHIETNSGISNMINVPLIAWVNYHEHEILTRDVFWLGHRAWKNPLDAWIYQEILYEVQPDIVIEIGNKFGGGTLFLASICELMGHGRVLALDIDRSKFTATHNRIDLLTGDCSSPDIIAAVSEKCKGKKTLIIHDADHTREAVLRDLRNFADMVSVDSYLIVEDSIQGVPGYIDPDRGVNVGPMTLPKKNTPLLAIEEFLQENNDFVIDESRERYILTENPKGFLRRVK